MNIVVFLLIIALVTAISTTFGGVKTVNYLVRIIPQLPRELPSCLLWYVIVLVIGQKIIISYLVSYSFNKVNDRIHNLILKIA